MSVRSVWSIVFKFTVSLLILCLDNLFIFKSRVFKVPNYYCIAIHFLLAFLQFLLYIFKCSGVGCINIYSCYIFFFVVCLKSCEFKVFLKNLFIYLFLAVLGLRFCARAFSSCGEWGPLFIAVRRPLTVAASLVAEHRLQMRRLSSCGSWTQLLHSMWDPPRPGLEPMSPALAGRFSTTAPPGKPLLYLLDVLTPLSLYNDLLCLSLPFSV